MNWEPEGVDWDAEGTCRNQRCERPLAEKPPGHCWNGSQHRCGARHGGSVNRCELRIGDCRRLSQDEREARVGVVPDKVKMRAYDVVKALHWKYRTPPAKMPEWLCMEEFQLEELRRVDFMALRLWSNRGLIVHSYEVKVARSDVLAELKNPKKRQPAIDCSTTFSFATPVGLMKPEEVPEECGLLEIGKGPRGRWLYQQVVPAPERRIEVAPVRLVHGIAWRLRDLQRAVQHRGIDLGTLR